MTPVKNDPLALRDIHLPADIAWWPPAPGWWMVFGMVMLLLGLGLFLYKRKQSRRFYLAARQELGRIRAAYEQERDERQLVMQLSTYLRRVCLSIYPRAEVASLTGATWLAYLDRGFGNSKESRRFSDGIGQILIRGPYQSARNHADQLELEALLSLCHSWTEALPRRRVVP